nr:MAG TPA: hypothetical protein [Caudoviricetes sp.]
MQRTSFKRPHIHVRSFTLYVLPTSVKHKK